MSQIENFRMEVAKNIEALGKSDVLSRMAVDWVEQSSYLKYSYNFSFLGRPVIQYPEDMVAIQEIIWAVKPDLVIETGIAHGGSLVMSAAMLGLIDYTEAVKNGVALDPKACKSRVLGLDIDIRPHNRDAIQAHPMSHRIDMIQGSSIDPEIIKKVHDYAAGYNKILVILDSNHTHEHVLAELEAYAPLTSKGSYCIVFDTVVEDMPENMFQDRPWGKGDNPKTAVWEYMKLLGSQERTAVDGDPLNFMIDKSVEHKLLITVAPDGYLKRI